MMTVYRFRTWHYGTMPNYCPKGVSYMRELARRGGLKSGERRRGTRAMRILSEYAQEKGIASLPDPIETLLEAGFFQPENCSGGSHYTEWRCPNCHHFNSIRSRACAQCKAVSPRNGRLTRAAFRARMAEHRTRAILAKHGL